MEPAGMVHALEKIHQCLKPEGGLIDIHPSGLPPTIEVWVGEQTTPIGWMKETDDFVEYGQASGALAQAVERGWFAVEREGSFEFTTRAGSVVELRDYLAKEWKDAILEESVAAKAEALLGAQTHDSGLMVREQIRIARLRLLV
jgi:hypothetical protein